MAQRSDRVPGKRSPGRPAPQPKRQRPEDRPFRYLLFFKPYDVLSTFGDPEGRRTVSDYVHALDIQVAGRLDQDSEGLLLLTDDGDLAHQLTHPAHDVPKTYLVQVENVPEAGTLEMLRRGVPVKGATVRASEVELLANEPELPERAVPIRYRPSVPTAWLRVVLREGKKRQIRHMTAAVGHPTLRLVRVALGPLTLRGLQPGQWREVAPEELESLRRALASGPRPERAVRSQPSPAGKGQARRPEPTGERAAADEKPRRLGPSGKALPKRQNKRWQPGPRAGGKAGWKARRERDTQPPGEGIDEGRPQRAPDQPGSQRGRPPEERGERGQGRGPSGRNAERDTRDERGSRKETRGPAGRPQPDRGQERRDAPRSPDRQERPGPGSADRDRDRRGRQEQRGTGRGPREDDRRPGKGLEQPSGAERRSSGGPAEARTGGKPKQGQSGKAVPRKEGRDRSDRPTAPSPDRNAGQRATGTPPESQPPAARTWRKGIGPSVGRLRRPGEEEDGKE